MLQVNYDCEPPILTLGTDLKIDILLRFRADVPESPRRNLNLSLVIDRSGSMGGQPLYHALKAAESVVQQLTPEDIISVVVYDDAVNTVVEPTQVREPARIQQALGRVYAGGLTNLAGGWLKGCEHVKAGLDSQKINRVLLLTDGLANVGLSDPQALTNTSAQKAEEGITTTTLGFNQGFNEDLLIGMARASQGNFYFIQSIDDATEVFGIELDSLRAVVGQNLQVTLELAPGVSLVDTLSLAQVSQNSQGQTLLTLGELYEGEDKLLGLSLKVSQAAQLGDLPLLQIHYSADVLRDNLITGVTGNAVVMAKVGSAEEAALAFSCQVVLELTRLNIAKAKEVALSLAEQGKHEEGEWALRALIQQLRDRGFEETFEIAEEIEQLEYFAGRIAQKALGNAGRKELRDQSYQSLSRNRSDLTARGVTIGEEVFALPVATEVGEGLELICVREGGKLRVKVLSEGYDGEKNVQFPRAIRAEGARYLVASLELSADGSFYRVKGEIKRLTKPGEVDTFVRPTSPRSAKPSAKTAKGPASAADLPTTDEVGDGVLVQCIKEGNKLRARVVSDGYEPDWNMRFPRSVREEGMLYVVEEIRIAPDGKSYIACGNIKRLLQPTTK